jgi:rod shape determining protein RodA
MSSALALANESLWRRLERLDWTLAGAATLLAAAGLVFIASASHGASGEQANFLVKQVIFLAMGTIVLLGVLRLDYLALLRYAPLAYFVLLLLLCGVLLTRPVNGARSWFDLRFFKLQPSEFFKPVLVMTLAHYLMYRDSYKRLSGLLLPMTLFLVPVALILRQPDLGTALAVLPVVFALLFAAGARLWHLALMLLTGASGLTLMWFTVMKDYQKRRLLAWLWPEEYRLAEAWQTLRSELSIGSGGWFGAGWSSSTPAGYGALPERHTDFIFAVVSEEGGFIAASLIMLFHLALVFGALSVALRTREPAGRLIAVGLGALLGGQALVNAGVTLGLLPCTGLTMPFVSYGGSSLVSSCACLGLLLNIASRRHSVLAKEDFA